MYHILSFKRADTEYCFDNICVRNIGFDQHIATKGYLNKEAGNFVCWLAIAHNSTQTNTRALKGIPANRGLTGCDLQKTPLGCSFAQE